MGVAWGSCPWTFTGETPVPQGRPISLSGVSRPLPRVGGGVRPSRRYPRPAARRADDLGRRRKRREDLFRYPGVGVYRATIWREFSVSFSPRAVPVGRAGALRDAVRPQGGEIGREDPQDSR